MPESSGSWSTRRDVHFVRQILVHGAGDDLAEIGVARAEADLEFPSRELTARTSPAVADEAVQGRSRFCEGPLPRRGKDVAKKTTTTGHEGQSAPAQQSVDGLHP